MEKTLRLFYALWPDDATRDALAAWQFAVSGKKVPPQNLHITLVFLGNQPARIVPELTRILATLPAHAISLKLDDMGYFAHNRISWAGMKHRPARLVQLHHRLTTALQEKNIAFDNRNDFKPHITLARHSNRAGIPDLKPITWHAKHLVLVKSRLQQDKKGTHQQYLPLAERLLTGS